jgi:hypothetical protein
MVLLQKFFATAIGIPDAVGTARIIQAQTVHVIFGHKFGRKGGFVMTCFGVTGIDVATSCPS